MPLLFAACYYLNGFVKRNSNDKGFVLLDSQVMTVSDLLSHSKKLVKGLSTMTVAFSLAAVIGFYLFLAFSILLGLAIAFAGFLFSWFIINELDLFKRYRAIKELDEEILMT
ncbi:hypothetical protein DDV21_010905 [Streptococcus chenjunshii]|uniref:DUF3169 family protein n=1 Tax=Streptococcus chenjunshii TaxID=2173853 RepID=A0A372KIZ4_9STRE|nr:hypothetical protein DDV21_010905 [Streptococcus chenjunshii]RFU50109.1 hypothetical protein DDV22_10410 [Streptococcus chenjunshii]RFU52261.1 hypothetical protein DDV23_10635 [Streptococcus chenjunshii]